MADMMINSGSAGKKSKPQRKILRVDFTPMVDMNMLLITFFMFCTTLAIPQALDLAMPVPTDDPDNGTQEAASRAITVILDKDDKVFYYAGMPNYEDYTSLKETDFNGLRDLLLQRNVQAIVKVKDLNQKRRRKELTDADYKAQMKEIKNAKTGLTVVIKPTENSNFKNLVDALDEMQICSIGKYAVVDITAGDKGLLANYNTGKAETAPN